MPHSTAQPIDAVARTYARALFDLAEDKGQLDAVESDLRGVAQLWRDNADLERLMASRIISVEQHAGLVERLFQGRVNDWLYRFLQVVVRHRRGEKLLMISEAFDDLMDAKMGRIDVDAYVAQPLDDAALRRVTDDLTKALGKTVELEQHIDASLLGGLKLRIGDKLIDGSVAAQLRKMKQHMVDAGVAAKARIVTE